MALHLDFYNRELTDKEKEFSRIYVHYIDFVHDLTLEYIEQLNIEVIIPLRSRQKKRLKALEDDLD